MISISPPLELACSYEFYLSKPLLSLTSELISLSLFLLTLSLFESIFYETPLSQK